MRLHGLILKMGLWQSGCSPTLLTLLYTAPGYPLTLILAGLAFSVLGSLMVSTALSALVWSLKVATVEFCFAMMRISLHRRPRKGAAYEFLLDQRPVAQKLPGM
jgi:hypothetical protein